jgi:hypothetical protein
MVQEAKRQKLLLQKQQQQQQEKVSNRRDSSFLPSSQLTENTIENLERDRQQVEIFTDTNTREC